MKQLGAGMLTPALPFPAHPRAVRVITLERSPSALAGLTLQVQG